MKTRLCNSFATTAWEYISWAGFARMADKAGKVVILPVTCFADWGDLPLDVEETVTMRLLGSALSQCPDSDRFLVTPPQRFNVGRPGCTFFQTSPDIAHASLAALCGNIAQYGFRKVLFLNSNPFCTDFVDVAGRDLRISLGIQPFCINLSGLGLEFGKPEDCARISAIANAACSPELANTGKHLLSLLNEVHAFRPLPANGTIQEPML